MPYILLVEDNQDNANMITRLVETFQVELRHAVRGVDGIRMVQHEKPLLILMDFKLPDIDGRTIILLLKRQFGAHSLPPIVAITASTDVLEEDIARNIGCSAFIKKPFEPKELLYTIRFLLPDLPLAVITTQSQED